MSGNSPTYPQLSTNSGRFSPPGSRQPAQSHSSANLRNDRQGSETNLGRTGHHSGSGGALHLDIGASNSIAGQTQHNGGEEERQRRKAVVADITDEIYLLGTAVRKKEMKRSQSRGMRKASRAHPHLDERLDEWTLGHIEKGHLRHHNDPSMLSQQQASSHNLLQGSPPTGENTESSPKRQGQRRKSFAILAEKIKQASPFGHRKDSAETPQGENGKSTDLKELVEGNVDLENLYRSVANTERLRSDRRHPSMGSNVSRISLKRASRSYRTEQYRAYESQDQDDCPGHLYGLSNSLEDKLDRQNDMSKSPGMHTKQKAHSGSSATMSTSASSLSPHLQRASGARARSQSEGRHMREGPPSPRRGIAGGSGIHINGSMRSPYARREHAESYGGSDRKLDSVSVDWKPDATVGVSNDHGGKASPAEGQLYRLDLSRIGRQDVLRHSIANTGAGAAAQAASHSRQAASNERGSGTNRCRNSAQGADRLNCKAALSETQTAMRSPSAASSRGTYNRDAARQSRGRRTPTQNRHFKATDWNAGYALDDTMPAWGNLGTNSGSGEAHELRSSRRKSTGHAIQMSQSHSHELYDKELREMQALKQTEIELLEQRFKGMAWPIYGSLALLAVLLLAGAASAFASPSWWLGIACLGLVSTDIPLGIYGFLWKSEMLLRSQSVVIPISAALCVSLAVAVITERIPHLLSPAEAVALAFLATACVVQGVSAYLATTAGHLAGRRNELLQMLQWSNELRRIT